MTTTRPLQWPILRRQWNRDPWSRCPHCDGIARDGRCGSCRRVDLASPTGDETAIAFAGKCSKCGGSGFVTTDGWDVSCPRCGGSGVFSSPFLRDLLVNAGFNGR